MTEIMQQIIEHLIALAVAGWALLQFIVKSLM